MLKLELLDVTYTHTKKDDIEFFLGGSTIEHVFKIEGHDDVYYKANNSFFYLIISLFSMKNPDFTININFDHHELVNYKDVHIYKILGQIYKFKFGENKFKSNIGISKSNNDSIALPLCVVSEALIFVVDIFNSLEIKEESIQGIHSYLGQQLFSCRWNKKNKENIEFQNV